MNEIINEQIQLQKPYIGEYYLKYSKYSYTSAHVAATSHDEENEFDVIELRFNLFIRFEANETLDCSQDKIYQLQN